MQRIQVLVQFWILCTLILVTTNAIAQDIRMAAIPFPMYWENQPKSVKFERERFILEAGPKTDMFRDPNVTYNTDNAPKLMFRPDVDFILTAGIHHSFTSKWDGGAIVLRRDSLNWVKFCFEKDYTGARRVVSVVTRDISDDCNSVEILADKVYYKVARAGKVITLYYSLDNKNWFLVRHLQFPDDKPLSVGFLSQSPDGPSCKVTFSEIAYKAKKISDPYLGE